MAVGPEVGTVANKSGLDTDNVFVVTGGATADATGFFVVTVTDSDGGQGTARVDVTVTAVQCDAVTTFSTTRVTVSHDNPNVPQMPEQLDESTGLPVTDVVCDGSRGTTCIDVTGIDYKLVSNKGWALDGVCKVRTRAQDTEDDDGNITKYANLPALGAVSMVKDNQFVLGSGLGFSLPIDLQRCTFVIPAGTCSDPTSSDFSLDFSEGKYVSSQDGGVVLNQKGSSPSDDFKITVVNQ